MFVLQVTAIERQPSGILTRGPGSLRGLMPGRAGDWIDGWSGRGWSALSSPKLPPSVHHHRSSAFLMRPEGAVERAAKGAPPPHPRPVIDEPSAPAALLVERRPIHPGNTPTTHLAAVCTETHQFRPPLLAPTDSVDQTVARSLGLLLKINGAPVSHTLQQRQRLLFPPLLPLLSRQPSP